MKIHLIAFNHDGMLPFAVHSGMHDTKDLLELIKSRTPIVVLETNEELRALDLIKNASDQTGIPAYAWSVTQGLQHLEKGQGRSGDNYSEPAEILLYIWNLSYAGIYVLLDFHHYLENPRLIRTIKDIALTAADRKQTLVFLSHQFEIPGELNHYSARFDLQLPDEAACQQLILEEARSWVEEHKGVRVKVNRQAIEQMARNMTGLSVLEIKRLARHAMRDHVLDDSDVNEVTRAKYELLNKEDVIYYEPATERFSEVGGLPHLKGWLDKRRQIFCGDEKLPGVETPKGILLLGVQGSGKSLAAKAVAGSWGLPLLRLDFGTLFNKFYGETERKTREALKMAEVMAPCILWLDEIEKGLSTQDNDGGTSRRLLGTLLTWMAERQASVFMVATANDISSLPPELMRKGRLDEIFFVDLPDRAARAEIFKIHLKKRSIYSPDFNLELCLMPAKDFPGLKLSRRLSPVYMRSPDKAGISISKF